MLQIFDINTNSKNLGEVEQLKESFKMYLAPTVHNATIVIVSNFPSVGNMTGHIDYIFFIVVHKQGGSLRIKRNGMNYNIDSLVFLNKKILDNDVCNANNQYLYGNDSEFDYVNSIKINNSEFQEFCSFYTSIKSSMCYQFSTINHIQFTSPQLLINKDLTAKYIIESAANQYIDKYGGKYRINAFEKTYSEALNHEILLKLLKNIINETNKKFTNGILTKRKLDRISTSNKIVDNIYDNVGKSLTVIKGKAGTGKTLTLLRIMYKQAESNQKVRFLTFNNLLIFDIKQSLRNFGFYGDPKVSLRTVHRFFYELSEKLGIRLILNNERIKELLEVCGQRIYKLKNHFYDYFHKNYFLNTTEFLTSLPHKLRNEADYQEFREFVKFLDGQKDFSNFDNITNLYLAKKRSILLSNVGTNSFIQDYYK